MSGNSANPAGGSSDSGYSGVGASRGAARLAAVALGSNLGDRQANLHAATTRLATIPATELVRVSRFIETTAVAVEPGVDPGPSYLNAAAVVRTELSPIVLLSHLHDIERTLGRDRATQPHGSARVIDLDLLLMDDLVVNSMELMLPHPRMHERAFVLAPLASIAPGMVIPTLNCTVAAALTRLKEQRPGVKESR